MSLNVRIDAIDYQASNDHKNDQGSKDDQRYIQARSKCLGKYWIDKPIVCIGITDICLQIHIETSQRFHVGPGL